MNSLTKKPYVIYIAEIIYSYICIIKKKYPNIKTKDAIYKFIETEHFTKLSSGELHNDWFNKLKKDNYTNQETGTKIPKETIKLLEIQRDTIIKSLKTPNLYYAKNSYPLEITQNAFSLLWRMCESYELWCKETNQTKSIILDIID